jgi:hypothetical protein
MKLYALFVSKEKIVNTKPIAIDTIATSEIAQPTIVQRYAFVFGAAFALIALHLLFPQFAFGQEDPFAAIDSGMNTAIEYAQKWMLGFAVIGSCLYAVAHFGQGFWPEFYGQYRGFMRNSIMILIAVTVFINWVLPQIGGGS